MTDLDGATLSDDLQLTGRISFANARTVRDAGCRLIDARLAAQANADDPIVVDVAGLSYVSSITVAVLTAWYRHARLAGAHFEVAGGSDKLGRIIAFSGLEPVLGHQA